MVVVEPAALEEELADLKRLNVTNYQIVPLTDSAREYQGGVLILALIMWKQVSSNKSMVSTDQSFHYQEGLHVE